MKILLTNDDGIYAPGLKALYRELQKIGQVQIVAPASEQSGVGHSLTLLTPLVVQEVWEEGVLLGYAVEGRPADCVKLGIVKLLHEPPDLVVSGINAGSNAGINVHYSGTVAAAIEGSFLDVTSIAVSLVLPEPGHYQRAAELAVQVIQQILDREPKTGELFNVNIPNLSLHDPRGVRVTEQGMVCYRESYESRTDPRGRRYYWLLPDPLCGSDEIDCDLTALEKHLIAVTPLHFDMTDRQRLATMQGWEWNLQ